ncbi:MAG: hypothetical protein M4D85_03830 [Actinomycetota bacterium]|nr:hypothetical protein [Actinomycetota bacterium]
MSHISVSIDDEHLESMSSVARALQDQGMQVEQVLDGVGIITGSISEERRLLLASVPGVAAIADSSLTYQLPSPDAGIQ